MSEIWHRYDEAPKHQDIIMTDTGCWAYRADLFALETELERTRKALDVARYTVGWINQMIDEHTDKQAIKIKCEYALDQIKQITEKKFK